MVRHANLKLEPAAHLSEMATDKLNMTETSTAWHRQKTLLDFEDTYHKEYSQELESCDQWIAWCKKHGDTHGVNFHEGMRSAHVFNNIKMEQLIRVLKQEPANKL